MAGCASGADSSLPADRAENAVAASGERGGTMPRPPSASSSPAAVEADVRADAARRWNLPNGAALQVSIESVIWADGSIGCPQPGRMYTQALVPGWRLVVRDGGRELVYHASQRGQWVQCPPGRAQPPLPGAATR